MGKALTKWFWFSVFWTFTPFICAIVLIVFEIFAANVRGVIIQGFVLAPLAFAFRSRLGNMCHDVTDWLHGAGQDKEKTRWYQAFKFFSGSHVSIREKALLSIFEFIGLLFLFFYYITGLLLQRALS